MSKTIYKCIDAHTCGNPVRVVTTGCPDLLGNSMSEKRQHFLKEYDWIRKGLMYEPRGHDMMSGSFFFEPQFPENDFGKCVCKSCENTIVLYCKPIWVSHENW